MAKKQQLFHYYGTFNTLPAVTHNNNAMLVAHPSITPNLAEKEHPNLDELLPKTELNPVITLSKEALKYLDAFDKGHNGIKRIKFEATEQGIKCSPIHKLKNKNNVLVEHELKSITLASDILQLHASVTIALDLKLLKHYFKYYPLKKKTDCLALYSVDPTNPLTPLFTVDKTFLLMPCRG
jgi:hypothetical protein